MSTSPLLDHLGLPEFTVTREGSRVEFTVQPMHLRSRGVVHGGMYATVLDTLVGYASHPYAPPGADIVTMQLNVNMIGTAQLGETLVGFGRVQHAGRRTAVAQAELRRIDGKLLATATGTLFFLQEGLIPPPGEQSPATP